MISLSATDNAALSILRQVTSFSAISNIDSSVSAADRIAAIANRVSSEDSAVKTQASSRITSAFLDSKAARNDIAARAIDFVNSDSFKSSDPEVKDALTRLIAENPAKFAMLVTAEKSSKPGISTDNAIANAIRGVIKDNRPQFGDGEFLLGFKLANGGTIIANIEDVNGHSTSQALMSNLSDATKALTNFAKAVGASVDGNSEAIRAAASDVKRHDFSAALDAISQWWAHWDRAFGF